MATTDNDINDNNDVDQQEDEAPVRRAAQNDGIPMEGESEDAAGAAAEAFKRTFVEQMVRSVGGEFGMDITTENVEACVNLMERHREEICGRLRRRASADDGTFQWVHRHSLQFPFRILLMWRSAECSLALW